MKSQSRPSRHSPGRVLFCTQTAHPYGGVECWLDQSVGQLEAKGWDCVVALVEGHRFHCPDRYRGAHPRFKTVTVPGNPVSGGSRLAALSRTIRQVCPDVVVPVSLFDPLPAMALLKSQGFPVRLAVCCHSFAPAVLADLCIFRDWLDLMVGVNQLQLRVLTEMGVKADICRHIPCTAQHEPTGLERKEKTGPLHLVYVGRFEQTEKRVLDVLKLCGELEANNCEYRLSLVGDGSCRAELQAALAQQIAAGWVQWVGWCDRLKLAEEVYPRSDVLLLFSPSETGPIVAWEAMSHGVVPVVSDFRGRAAEGVIRQGQTGLVFPVGDMRTAAARIRELDKDRTRLSFLSQRARAAVADRADPARTTAAWLEALEATLRRPMRTGVLPDVAKHPGGGRLECWGVPPQWADCLRRWSGRQPEPIDPGAEWPHHGPGDPDLEAAIERALVEHDVEPAVRASASAIQESRLAAS